MKYIFLDIETGRVLERLEEPMDIIVQLSYIVFDTETKEKTIMNTLCNPGCELEYIVMSVNNITPEMIQDKLPVKETEEYKYLKNIIENEETVFFAHNAEFDIKILEMVDINVHEFSEVVDTLHIYQIINDQLELEYENCKLGYLLYHLGLYRDVPKVAKEFGIDEVRYHDAITDVLYLILLVRYTTKQMNAKIPQLIELCKEPKVLKYVPYGKNRKMLFEDLTYNQLLWYTTTYDKNVSHTAKQYI